MKKTLLFLGIFLSFSFLYAQRGAEMSRFGTATSNMVTEVPQIVEIPNFRGDNSPVYWGFANSGQPTNCYQTTVAGPFPGTTLGSAGINIQATEYINGTWYAVSFSGNTNGFGTLNKTTGAFTPITTSFGNDAMSLCYNPTNGLTYAFAWGGGSFGTVNLETGFYQGVGSTDAGSMYTAIDNLGDCYYISMNTNTGAVFGKVNLISGLTTQLGSIGFNTNYIQELSVDRETNELYWIATNFISATSNTKTYYKVNKSNGALTQITSLTSVITSNAAPAFAIANQVTSCEPVTNVNAEVQDNTVLLTWTAPAGGTPTGYKIECDGTPLTTVAPGTTTYTHTNAAGGLRQYIVTALFETGCTPLGVAIYVIVGDYCYIKLVMEDTVPDDETGKYYGWEGAEIQVFSGGIMYGTGTVPMDASIAIQDILVPSGEVQFFWADPTPYQDEYTFKVFNSDGEQIFHVAAGNINYTHFFNFLTYDNECGTPVIVCPAPTGLTVDYPDPDNCVAELKWTAPSEPDGFNIYRDGTLLIKVTGNSYNDTSFDPLVEHTWTVKSVCGDIESIAGATVTKPACQVGIKDNANTIFSIVPNPANNQIEITSMGNFNTVEVINFLGQTVISQPNINGTKVTLDISTLNNGIYFVRLISDNGATVKKFIKQ